ncbi:hypothetical protein HYH03_015255 [Edaphochlamys debaryana]|uniref:[phosphatase 2A protein]-leucine-carboxy methyltransferase n=1 Tax=Edaphochlamys debaryana TaxID=47281 RepID=A0A835XL22_9CHLO|nr:hypothetical protein HYH03_015255 [Edaphochlamys debaryana]|eukprot:KAG2486048.1 hypothetical protein HYH03_015255 [Edaphochlamys debaryana]
MLRSVEGSDASVQGTNDDAQVSKLSCSKAGYFRDEFIQYFVRRASRRSPLINRGYYSRHAALRQLLRSFLSACDAAGRVGQVLVLGAGFDTTWFQLAKDRGRVPYRCLEVDFKEVTTRKAAIIAKEQPLSALLRFPPPGPGPAQGTAPAGGQDQGPAASAGASSDGPAAPAVPDPSGAAAGPRAGAGGEAAGPGPGSSAGAAEGAAGGAGADVCIDAAAGTVRSPWYHLAPVDLRDVGTLGAAVEAAGFDPSTPTYVLSECVLVYMEPAHSQAVLAWAGGALSNAVVAIYEQIRPDDAFGRQMVSNLEMRGCPLRGLPSTPTLQAHRERLLQAGWAQAEARSMDELYGSYLDPADRQRVERLELFDELEEWHMIQEHYSIALGRNDAGGLLASVSLDQPPPPEPQPSGGPAPAPAGPAAGGLFGGFPRPPPGGFTFPGLARPPGPPGGSTGGAGGGGGRTLVVD